MKMKNIKISDIIVGGRARKSLGDVMSLAQSIKKTGLINPITITEDNKLIAGFRRLTAMSMNGEEYIPVTIVSMVDNGDMFKLEFAENEDRKDFTPSEKVELLKVITPKRGGDNNPSGCKGKHESTLPNGRVDSKTTENKRSTKVALAAGFSSRMDGYRAKRATENCIQEIVDLMDIGEISVTAAGDYISKLSNDEQLHVIEAVKKYGSRKWYYYEYQKSVINYLEKNKISRDQADGYTRAVKNGTRTTTQVTQELYALTKSMDMAKSKARSKESEEKMLHEEKWKQIEVSDSNLQKSMINLITALGIDDSTKLRSALNGALRSLAKNRV